MTIHYRESPWTGPQPTLCGLAPRLVAYTDNPGKVTCAKCAAALKAKAA